MSFMYLYRACKNKDIDNRCAENFSKSLQKQASELMEIFGKTTEIREIRSRSILIGLLSRNFKINGIKDLYECEGRGVIFSGICEQYLEKTNDRDIVDEMFYLVEKKNSELSKLSGRFSCILFDNNKEVYYIFNGATEHMTLWYTNCRNGFAIGNRSAPILEFTNQSKQQNTVAEKLYLNFGYLFSNESMFRNVYRLKPRSLIVLQKEKEPKFLCYCSMSQYFSGLPELSLDNIVEDSCNHLVSRVEKQFHATPKATLLLTAGYDSRLIASALKHVTDNISAKTGGKKTSVDYQGAKVVSNKLGFDHILGGDKKEKNINYMSSFASLWSLQSEGMEGIRQALSVWDDSIMHNFPTTNLFHGLGGEIRRGYYYDIVNNATLRQSPSRATFTEVIKNNFLKYRDQDVNEAVEKWCHDFASELEGLDLNMAQWLELYYWQNRCLNWGEDMMSVKHPTSWRWTPLFDRNLIRLSWKLEYRFKSNSLLPQRMVLKLAPELEGIPYGGGEPISRLTPKNILRKIVSKLQALNKQANPSDSDIALSREWIRLIDTEDELVQTFFGRQFTHRLITERPNSESMWNLATVLMFKKAHIDIDNES